jgi:CheY-like chemotaxis protein
MRLIGPPAASFNRTRTALLLRADIRSVTAMRFFDNLGIRHRSVADAASRRASVLLVDDSPDNRLVLRELLKHAPYDIEEANNGAIAVAKVKLRTYDLIVMDLLMPEMDGFEAMRQIRRYEDSRPIDERAYVIALTAWALKEAELESYQCGADIHMTKPIRKAQLLDALGTEWASIIKRRSIADNS